MNDPILKGILHFFIFGKQIFLPYRLPMLPTMEILTQKARKIEMGNLHPLASPIAAARFAGGRGIA